mgnify:CR=1 FL=1
MENPGQAKVTITLEPMGKRIAVAKRTSILQAAQEAGIDVVAVCGGIGACATCKVFSISGEFSPITAAEEEQLTASELQSGLRLGCQTQFLSDCTVFFPPESLATFQRLQLEGRQVETAIEPAVSRVEIDLSDISGLDMDHAADLAFAKVCKKHGQIASFPEYLKPELFRELSENQSKAVLAVHGREIIAVLPPKAQMLGFAVDVGTTKLAGYVHLMKLRVVELLLISTLPTMVLAERGWPPPTRLRFDDEVAAGSLYVGSPETVARRIAATVATLGLRRFDLKYATGPMPHAQLMSSIELYGSRVVPLVRDLLA